MNILYFLNYYPTKHKIVAHDEMLEMSRRGHHITVIAVWGGEKEKTDELPFEIIYLKNKVFFCVLSGLVLRFPLKTISHLFLLKRYLGFRDSLKYLSAYPKLKKTYPDRIHAHFANNAALKGYLFSKFINATFSCTGHGSELLLYPEPYLKELIINAKPFITISNYNKELLTEKYLLSSDQIVVNYCGIDTDYFSRTDKDKKPNVFTIISVTALKPMKGVIYLIEACKLLKQQNISYNCHIIGGGNDYQSLNDLIHKLNIADSVHLLEAKSQDEIRENLKISDVFVLPSLSEGIPVAVMEAMAMELPVIATNITGLPEIIDDGVNGYLVPPQDPKTLADKITDLYNNTEKRTVFGKAARQTIVEKFNLKTNVAKFENLVINSGSVNPESSFSEYP